LSKGLRKLFKPERGPEPLPATLLPELVRQSRILLCLDYDGTLSEIAPEPQLARPAPGVLGVLKALAARRDRLAIAIVSGRELEDLRDKLPLRGAAMAGVHGLQLLDADGVYELASGVAECRDDFMRARAWLEENVPPAGGFVIEDKGIAVALHYRNAPPAMGAYVGDAFAQFIAERTMYLAARRGKMVVEALPKIASKANAVRTLLDRAGGKPVPVYFGDDLTDEDAFTEIGEDGVTVLVGERRRTAARYQIGAPRDVVRALAAIASALWRSETKLPEG
jgi:trehalose 6-phosphate phosphatase